MQVIRKFGAFWRFLLFLLASAERTSGDVYDYEYRGDLFNGSAWLRNRTVVCAKIQRCECYPQTATCDWMCVIQQCMVMVSFPVYVLQILAWLVYRKSSNMESAFFTFCISTGFMDISNICHWYIWEGWPQMGAPWRHWMCAVNSLHLGTHIKSGFYYFYVGTLLGMLFMTCSRFTAFVWPLQNPKIWSSTLRLSLLVVQLVTPLIYVIPLHVVPGARSFIDENMLSRMLDHRWFVTWIVNTHFVTSNLVMLPLYILMYTVICVRLAQQRSKKTAAPPSSTTAAVTNGAGSTALFKKTATQNQLQLVITTPEIRLGIAGGIICMSFALYRATTLVQQFVGDYGVFYYVVHNFTKNIWLCCNPWLMMVFSSATRKGMLAVVQLKSTAQFEALFM